MTVYGTSGTTKRGARLATDTRVKEDDTVTLGFLQNKMHFFDAESEVVFR